MVLLLELQRRCLIRHLAGLCPLLEILEVIRILLLRQGSGGLPELPDLPEIAQLLPTDALESRIGRLRALEVRSRTAGLEPGTLLLRPSDLTKQPAGRAGTLRCPPELSVLPLKIEVVVGLVRH